MSEEIIEDVLHAEDIIKDLRDENVELRDALRVIAVHALQAPGVDVGEVSDE